MGALFTIPIEGVSMGHAVDAKVKTGTTACVFDAPSVAAMHIMGASPGTRETQLLRPEHTVDKVDALVISGGSAFGLDAATYLCSEEASLVTGVTMEVDGGRCI